MANAGTPAQTVGPFFHCALPYPGDSQLIGDEHGGALRLHGTVYDGAGNGVPDALIELWQPDPDGTIVQEAGSLHRTTFTGWGRAATDDTGHYTFTTLRPGGQPPFFALTVFARGLLDALFTRAYLPGAEVALPGLGATRRKTLMCVADPGGYRFDIHLQGPDETVFLAFRGDQS